MIRPVVIAFLGFVLASCTAARPSPSPIAVPSDPHRVSCEELMATREPTLHGALWVSRPSFLRPRTAWTPGPTLYVDGVATVDLDALYAIALTDVLEVAFLTGPDATTRFGSNHQGGALLVRTRRGPAFGPV